jgi:hypothetical protein
MDKLPPRWVRRIFIAPVVFVGAMVVALVSPFVHLVAALLDILFDHRRWRISRLVGVALAFSVAEAFGLFALFTVWLVSGFGVFMSRPFWVKANNVLTGQYMAMVTNAICFFVGFRFSLTLEGEVEGAHIVLARHVGPGDVLRLMKVVFRDMGRRCHAVGAVKLQWDPFLDIAGERLGFRYLHQTPTDTVAELDRIRRLTSEMEDDETLILCPEGGNFTPRRRQARIDYEKARGRHERVETATRLKHTLLPKTGGAVAALEGPADATVTVLGHVGLDDVHGLRSLWRLMPLNRTVVAHGWTKPLHDLPSDRAGRRRWLFESWERLDEWIDRELATGLSAARD